MENPNKREKIEKKENEKRNQIKIIEI